MQVANKTDRISSLNMSDSAGVLHAAILEYEDEEQKAAEQKKAKKPKPEFNQMWENLHYLEEQQKKIDKDAPKVEVKKPKKKVEKKVEEKLDANFDDSSLAVYGAMLTEQLEKGEPGQEVARPQELVGEILSKAEEEKRENN